MNRITTIPAAETMRRKRILNAKLKELRGGSVEREDLRLEYLADPLDQLRSSADREVVVQRLDHQARLIRDVQISLDKIREGEYGLCERCEKEIPGKRLDVVPWARLCVPCQAHAEATERRGTHVFEDAA